jgi:hypothetical protein
LESFSQELKYDGNRIPCRLTKCKAEFIAEAALVLAGKGFNGRERRGREVEGQEGAGNTILTFERRYLAA